MPNIWCATWLSSWAICTQNQTVPYDKYITCVITIIWMTSRSLKLQWQRKHGWKLTYLTFTAWMTANKLTLNQEKMELITPVAKSIFQLEKRLSASQVLERQVNAISSACCYHNCHIGCISHYISMDACKTLAHA